VAVSSVTISRTDGSGDVETGNTVSLLATVNTGATEPVNYQWQYFDGTWKDLTGETDKTCTVIVSNIGSNQFRVRASNSCSGTVEDSINITGKPIPVGGNAARISWDPVNGEYVATYDPREAGLLFKFGSVVGLFSDHHQNKDLSPTLTPSTDTYDSGDVAWTPVGGASYVNYGDIPFTVNPAAINIIYHSAANVKLGLGDPCRLIGLNLNYIKNTLSPSEMNRDLFDNRTWRLPTGAEVAAFSGYPVGTYEIGSSPADWWWAENQPGNISYGVAGAEFPSRGAGGMNRFMPAVGYRDEITGNVEFQGEVGETWSSDNEDNPIFAYDKEMIVNVPTIGVWNPIISPKWGLSVRCVYDPTPPCVAVSSVTISRTDGTGSVEVGYPVNLEAKVNTGATSPISYQWQYLDGIWRDIVGETDEICSAIVRYVGSNQFRVRASNACSGEVYDVITITGRLATPGGSATRITWDDTNGRYVSTYDPRDAGLLFKFGSVVGIYTDHHHVKDLTPPFTPSSDSYDPGDVPWSPTSPSTTYSTYTSIPYTTLPTAINNGYHNTTNVKAGKGDPCRLIGLNWMTIQNAPDASSLTIDDIDNKVWRMPTIAEIALFSGVPSGGVWISGFGPPTGWWWTMNEPGNISYGVPGAEFPGKTLGSISSFMPAVGVRDENGLMGGQGDKGETWASDNITNPYFMFADFAIMNASGSTPNPHYAFSIRCVRQ